MLEEMLSSCVESFLGQGMCILVLIYQKGKEILT